MSLTVIKALPRVAGRLLQETKNISRQSDKFSQLLASRTLQTHRCFTRSLWYMCNRDSYVHQISPIAKRCGCCGLHTEGDKELSDFLNDEIKLERENEKTPGKLPRIKGFEVVKAEGPEVVLQKSVDSELITVRFNVNHSIDEDMPDVEPRENEAPEMYAKPPFIVEINKGGAKSLALQVQFPSNDDIMPDAAGQQQEYSDVIEVSEAAIIDHGTEWSDKEYALSGSVMDGNLYDMLMNMLEERGIDGDFIQQLIDFSTSYEHKKYISFLEQLKDFTGGK